MVWFCSSHNQGLENVRQSPFLSLSLFSLSLSLSLSLFSLFLSLTHSLSLSLRTKERERGFFLLANHDVCAMKTMSVTEDRHANHRQLSRTLGHPKCRITHSSSGVQGLAERVIRGLSVQWSSPIWANKKTVRSYDFYRSVYAEVLCFVTSATLYLSELPDDALLLCTLPDIGLVPQECAPRSACCIVLSAGRFLDSRESYHCAYYTLWWAEFLYLKRM